MIYICCVLDGKIYIYVYLLLHNGLAPIKEKRVFCLYLIWRQMCWYGPTCCLKNHHCLSLKFMYILIDLWLTERSHSSCWIHKTRTAVPAFLDLHNPRVSQRILGLLSQLVALNCDLYYWHLVYVIHLMILRIAKINRKCFFDTGLSTAKQIAPLCSIDVMLCGEWSNSKIAWWIMSVANEWNVSMGHWWNAADRDKCRSLEKNFS